MDQYEGIMTELKQKHQCAIDLLEAIEYYNTRIKTERELIGSFHSQFPRLISKSRHNIDIYTRCIERIKQRYYSLFNN